MGSGILTISGREYYFAHNEKLAGGTACKSKKQILYWISKLFFQSHTPTFDKEPNFVEPIKIAQKNKPEIFRFAF